jgi:AcrR family transcriptional regulator
MRKEQLLDAAIGYLVTHGIANLSLRPLASELGTSARLLIFHFGSKDGLIRDVLNEVHARLEKSMRALPPATPDTPDSTPMKRFWVWATDQQNLPYLRLLYEVQFIALQNPRVYARYLQRASLDWIEAIEQRLPEPIRTKSIATLCAAAFDGLVIELLMSGDLRRTSQALDELIGMLMREHTRRASGSRAARARPGRTARVSK